MKIGVFDSGIGGLNVLNEIIKNYPNANYIYFGDTANIPYGEKSKDELLKCVCPIINFFIKNNVDKIIIACGTVSSTIYNELKQLYNIPIISIIDYAINKIKTDNIENIAVLATQKTIDSHVFSNRLEISKVLEIPCPKFVPLIEYKIGNKEEIIEEYLKPIKEEKINNIVLGCTHYPLLKQDIKNYLNYPVKFYDMGQIIAESINITEDKFNLVMYFSKVDNALISNIKDIIIYECNINELVL